MMKGVAAFSIGLDALAGREQQLHFDRSSIHTWGVFADGCINAGNKFVEYMGNLSGMQLLKCARKSTRKQA